MSQSSAEKAHGPPKHMWARHKATIENFYIKQKITLKEVIKLMEAQGFKASEQQYKNKFAEWGFSKYKKRESNRRDRGDSSEDQAGETKAETPERGNPKSSHMPVADVPADNPGHASQALWDGNFDIDMVDFNNPINMYYYPEAYEPINLGIPPGLDVSAPLRPLGTTGTKIRQPIHQAAQSGYLDMVKLLLEKAPSCAGLPGKDGVTAIWLAAQQGHLEIVKLLLNYPVDVNAAANDSMRTPIHQAAQNGHTEIVRLLLLYEAVANPIDNDNITPLWSAAQQGYHEIVQILLGAGVDKEATSTDGGRRPIHQAAQNGHFEIVRLLLDAGAEADPYKYSFDDKTPSPLWLAAQKGHCGIAKLLIRNGADVNFSIHPSKRFPIHQAAQNGYIDVVGLLVQNGADVDAREENDWPPIMIAAQENYIEIVDLLLQNGANVNAEEKDGVTALWIASQQGHAQLIKKLLDKGAKSFASKSALRRPIHQAAQNGHVEAVKLLVEQDPQDIHTEEKKGVTPLLLASQGETPCHLEVARYLLTQGAEAVL